MNFTLETRLPQAVAVLPLDGHVLLPASATPYRVTDHRHKRLVEDLLDKPIGERWVAVPPRLPIRLADDDEHEVAALGQLTIATPLSGGEFIIVVEGRSACRLEAGPTGVSDLSLPYRMARVRHLVDRPEPLDAARRSTTALIQALFSLYDCFGLAASELPANDQPIDDIGLVYRIGSAVIEDPLSRARLLTERCPARRRELVRVHIVDQLAFAQRERLLGRPVAAC